MYVRVSTQANPRWHLFSFFSLFFVVAGGKGRGWVGERRDHETGVFGTKQVLNFY